MIERSELDAILRATSNVISLGYMSTWKLTEDDDPMVAIANARIVADSGWLEPEFLDAGDPATNAYLAAIGPDQARTFHAVVGHPYFGGTEILEALKALAEAVPEDKRDWTDAGQEVTVRPGLNFWTGSGAVTDLLVRMSPARVIAMMEGMKA